MKKIAFLTMFLLIIGLAAGAQASITIFYKYLPSFNGDTSAFLTQCPHPIVENFEDTSLITGLSITETNFAGTIANGVYTNIVDVDTNNYQTFTYSPGMYGFGGWFDLAGPGGPGTAIDVYIADTSTFVMNIPNTAAGQFYGFFSTTAFSQVRLQEHDTYAGWETYAIVDLAVCPVPVPPSLLLLGTGLVALVGLRRKIF